MTFAFSGLEKHGARPVRANLGQPKSPSADGEGIHALPTLLSFLRIVAEPNILRLGLHQRKLAQIYFWNSLYEILFLDGLAHFAVRALHVVDICLERVIVHRRYAEIEANLITHLQEGWQQLRGWYIWHKNADRFFASQKRSRGEWLTIRKRHAPAILQAALDATLQRQRSFSFRKDLAELSKTMVPHMCKQTAEAGRIGRRIGDEREVQQWRETHALQFARVAVERLEIKHRKLCRGRGRE